MQILYSADLHGNARFYQELFDLAVARHVPLIVIGGDLLPHGIRIASAIEQQRRFVAEVLQPQLQQLQAKLPEARVYLVPGNDDWAAAYAAIEGLAEQRLVYSLHEQVHQCAEAWWIAGLGYVPPTPFSLKDYERRDDDGPLPAYSYEMAYVSSGTTARRATPADLLLKPTIQQSLTALAQQSDPARTVYVCHAPPYGTALDNGRGGKSWGSRAVQWFIQTYQPRLTLHGHVHEAPATTRQFAIQQGRCWSVNPGRDGQQLHAVVITLDEQTIRFEHTRFGLSGTPPDHGEPITPRNERNHHV